MIVRDDLVTMTQETIEQIEKEEAADRATVRARYVIEKGEYPGKLVEWERRPPEQDETRMFHGHPVFSTSWALDVLGTEQTLKYIDVCPDMVRYDDNRISLQTKLGRDLCRLTQMVTGQPFEAVLHAAMEVPVVVSVTKKADGTKNYITKVRLAG